MQLLALDEPLGALDALTRIGMQDLIERIWRAQGFTALLVTHDVTEAVALADRILVVDSRGKWLWHFPTPGDPVRPTVHARPVRGKSAAERSARPASPSSTREMARATARASPASTSSAIPTSRA